MNLSFTVYGTPQPQGSARAVPVKGYAKPFITSDNKRLKPWRQEIAGVALDAMAAAKEDVSGDAIEVRIKFYFAKPRSASKRLIHKITRPDCDKLLRGVLDALKGIVYADDSHVVSEHVLKLFGTPERLEIEVRSFALLAEPGTVISKDYAQQLLLANDDLPPFDGGVIEQRKELSK